MKYSFFLLAFIIIFTLASCSCKKGVLNERITTEYISDSLTREKLKIITPPSSIKTQLDLCSGVEINPINFEYNSKFVDLSLKKSDTSDLFDLNIESKEIIEVKDSINLKSKEIKTNSEIKEVPVKNKINKYLLIACGVLLILPVRSWLIMLLKLLI